VPLAIDGENESEKMHVGKSHLHIVPPATDGTHVSTVHTLLSLLCTHANRKVIDLMRKKQYDTSDEPIGVDGARARIARADTRAYQSTKSTTTTTTE
jgi:hypothetical protein